MKTECKVCVQNGDRGEGEGEWKELREHKSSGKCESNMSTTAVGIQVLSQRHLSDGDTRKAWLLTICFKG